MLINFLVQIQYTFWFKKDFKLQIHLHKAFFSNDRFLHKFFLDQTTLDLRKEKWTFLNREFTVLKLLQTFACVA